MKLVWVYKSKGVSYPCSMRVDEEIAPDAVQELLKTKEVSNIALVKNGQRIEFGSEQLMLR